MTVDMEDRDEELSVPSEHLTGSIFTQGMGSILEYFGIPKRFPEYQDEFLGHVEVLVPHHQIESNDHVLAMLSAPSLTLW